MTIPPRYVDARPAGTELWGTVYVATHAGLGRPTLLHVLSEGFVGDARARLLEGVRRCAALGAPAVVTVYDLDEAAGFFALECAAPGSLADTPPLDAASLARALGSLARALRIAHASGVVHGRLAPSQLRLRGDGSVSVGLLAYPVEDGVAHVPSFDAEALPYLPDAVVRGDTAYGPEAETMAALALCRALAEAVPDVAAALAAAATLAEAETLLDRLAAASPGAPVAGATGDSHAADAHDLVPDDGLGDVPSVDVDDLDHLFDAPGSAVDLTADEETDGGERAPEAAGDIDTDDADLDAAQHAQDDDSGAIPDQLESTEAADHAEHAEHDENDENDENDEASSLDFATDETGGLPMGEVPSHDEAAVEPARHLEPDAAEHLLARLRAAEELVDALSA